MNIKRIGLIGGNGVSGGNSSIKIVNDLTTGGADKALSAEQGKILNSTKQNTLNGTEFKTVNGSSIWGSGNIVITGEGGSVEIINDLTTGGTSKALSAEMGKELAKEATIEHKGLMSVEDKEKLYVNDTTLSNIVNSTINDYSNSMDWELVYNNNENSTDYISSVQKNDDGSILLIPSIGGRNMSITTYIGTPKSGEIINIRLNGLSKADHPTIVTESTSTNSGIALMELNNNNGVWSASIKGNGKPLYLRIMIYWSATPSAPASINNCYIKGINTEFVEDFVTKEDLITEKFVIIPKAEKSYNPGNGELGFDDTRFGTSLIRVSAGMILTSNVPDDYYFVLFDYNKNYISYNRPRSAFLQNGYYRVAEGVEYVAITTYTDFENTILKVVDESVPVIFPVTYNEAMFQPWNQVPAVLRKNGVMVTYQLPNGENVIEVFQDPGNINLVSNSFGQSKYWKRVAYTDIVSGINPHPMKDKTFYSIGDSHRWKWLNKLAEITGAISGGDIFNAALEANETFYVSRTVAMAKYIVDLYKAGNPVDYIFLEYVHKYFTNNLSPSDTFHYSGDITEAEPFLTQAYYNYTTRTFNNSSEALSFWNESFADIVSQFTPKSTSIIALKTGVKIQTPKFKLLSDTTTEGNFTIKFTDNNDTLYQITMAITAGLTINEALTLINEIEFADSGCKWDNLNAHNIITDASLKFTYVGNLNDIDADIKMLFDFGTTGITYDGDWSITTETKDWIRGFKSHDISEWNNIDKWHDLNANMDAYIWIKAAVELLQKEIPTAKIFVWTLCTESWNYTDNTIEGKSVLYPDGTLNVQAIYDSLRHKRMVQNVEGWEKVAKYYHLGFIPISEMNSISPANHKYYYATEDVHPTQEGYDRVAEILANNVY